MRLSVGGGGVVAAAYIIWECELISRLHGHTVLWSDPDPTIVGWGYNSRGVSYTFGHDCIHEFLDRHDLDLICRAHQVVEDGYEFQAARGLAWRCV